MSRAAFEQLSERLLRAGVAPRHVRRYVRELQDHHDDLYAAELTRGLSADKAAAAARVRLGDDDALLQSMLARPELQSSAARHPALVLGAGPLLLWLLLFEVTLRGTVYALSKLLGSGGQQPAWLLPSLLALCTGLVRVLPVLLSAAVLIAAARQRSRAGWPITGAVLVTFLCATIITDIDYAGQLGMSSPLLDSSLFMPLIAPWWDALGPRDMALRAAIVRTSFMLALTLVPYALWQRCLGLSPRGRRS